MCLNFWVVLPPLTLWCALVPGAFLLTPAGVVGAVYIGLFEMGLAFLAWSTALRLAPNSSLVANLIFLSPFVSLQLIAFILEESIHVTTWAGLGLIIAGLLWQQCHKQTVV
jgi:drug/metabolite transporter (DMT)-like permease